MIIADVHEPPEFYKYLNGVVDTERRDLNSRGYADYYWHGVGGREVQIERKQWGELLSGLDSIENQLRNHLQRRPECTTGLLVEGLVCGSPTGTVILRGTSKNNIYVPGYESGIRLTQVYAWLYQVSNYIQIYFTSGYFETCQALLSFYRGDQKPEDNHTTFKRTFKKIQYTVDPRVTQFMGAFPNIGEKRAIALVRKFGTLVNLVVAGVDEVQEVDGMGPKLATTLLRQAGRLDV